VSSIDAFIDLIAQSNDVSIVRRAMHDIAILGRLTNDADAQRPIATQGSAGDPAIPEDWQWSVLEDVTTRVHYGYTASASRTKSDAKMLRITDIQDDRVNWDTVPYCDIDAERAENYSLENGDLLIARTGGTIGKTYLAEGIDCRAVFASYLIRATPNHRVLPRFLKAYTSTSLYWQQLYAGAAGTGQPNVNASTLKKLRIPLPPLAEQKRIVAKVDQLMALCDELEAKQNAQRQLGTRLTRSALDALTTATTPDEFTTAWHRIWQNFETFVAKPSDVNILRTLILSLAASGKLIVTPNQSKRTTLTPGLAFSIPDHWQWTTVGNAGELKLGRQRAPSNHHGSNMVPYLRVANVHENRLALDDILEMHFEPEEAKRFELKPMDVLLNEGQSYELIGRPALYRGEIPGACFQNTLIRFRAHENVDPEFALIVFRAYLRIGRFMKEAQQTTNIAHLSAGRLAAIEFPLPTLMEQRAIVAKVAHLANICDELEAKLQSTEEKGGKLAAALVQQLVV